VGRAAPVIPLFPRSFVRARIGEERHHLARETAHAGAAARAAARAAAIDQHIPHPGIAQFVATLKYDVIPREVRDRVTNAIQSTADYSELGWLLISVALIGFCAPLLTVFLVQHSPLRTRQ